MVEFVARSPLKNTIIDGAEIWLNDEIRIRVPTPHEIAALEMRSKEPIDTESLLFELDLEDLKTVLEVRHEASETASVAGRLINDTYRAVTALRLFTGGDIGAPEISAFIEMKIGDEEKKRIVPAWAVLLELETRWDGEPLVIQKNNEKKLQQFFRNVIGRIPLAGESAIASATDYVNVAIRHFNTSYSRDSIYDRLLELMIASEALFLEGRDELAYRLSRRAGIFLGDSDEEVEHIVKDMKLAYELRSAVVHASPLPSEIRRWSDTNPREIEAFVKRIERLLARALRVILVLPLSRKDAFGPRLDECLVSSSKRENLRKEIGEARDLVSVE